MTIDGKGGKPRAEQENPKVWDIAAEALEAGLTQRDAAIIAGIGESTLRERIAKDPRVAARMELAMARPKREYLDIIAALARSADEDSVKLKAAITMLEKRWPKEFGSRATLQIERPEPSQMETAELVAELEEALANAKAKLSGG